MQNFDIEQHGSVVTVTAHEAEFSYPQMRRLDDDLFQRVDSHGAKNFVFDMAEVQFLDSSCIGRLIALLEHVKPAGGRIVLANCHSNVELLFRMTHIDTLINLVDSVDQALEACCAAVSDVNL